LTVIFSTYQSLNTINVAQKKGVSEFDLVICDEAHRTTGAQIETEESQFVRIHDSKFIKTKKRLYMTATPRLYTAESKSRAKEREIPVWSMDDENVYGKQLYYLGFSQAVSEGLLSDYKVVVLGVDENVVSREIQSAFPKNSNKKELPLVDPAKIVGCWNALAGRIVGDDAIEVAVNSDTERLRPKSYKPLHRAVAFTTSIKQSEKFSEQFKGIIADYHAGSPDDKNVLHCEVQHVDGTQNAHCRNKKLDWLKQETETNECRILSNARCLSEGVDVPALDAVMFLTPRKSQATTMSTSFPFWSKR
jgi:predicted helicase